jgi:hypothetical protein
VKYTEAIEILKSRKCKHVQVRVIYSRDDDGYAFITKKEAMQLLAGCGPDSEVIADWYANDATLSIG